MNAILSKLSVQGILRLTLQLRRIPQTSRSTDVFSNTSNHRSCVSLVAKHSPSILFRDTTKTGSRFHSSEGGDSLGRWSNVLAIVAATYALDVAFAPVCSSCEPQTSSNTFGHSNDALPTRVTRFKDWLAEHGGDISAVGLAPTSEVSIDSHIIRFLRYHLLVYEILRSWESLTQVGILWFLQMGCQWGFETYMPFNQSLSFSLLTVK
jgi:hypothetical protein